MEHKESQFSHEDEGIETSGVLAINGLTYKLPPDLSVSIQRNNQSQYFQSQSYGPGATAVCVLNTGASFVDWRRSYLVMTVVNNSQTSAPATTNAYFGPNGSALNLINRLMIQTRSGAVIERVDNANQLASARLFMEHDVTWSGKSLAQSTAGVGGTFVAPTNQSITDNSGCAKMYGAQQQINSTVDTTWYEAWSTGSSMRFVIPCGELSPAFRYSQSLWPASLCSGMRIELLLEQPYNAMLGVNATDTLSYTVSEIRFECECYQLSDMVLRVLNTMASSSALEVVTVTAHDTPGTRNSASYNLDSGRAASRSLAFLYRERPAFAGGAGAATFDPFATISNVPSGGNGYLTAHQARIGALYFPQATVKNQGGAAGWKTAPYELYMIALQCLGKLGISGENCGTNPFQYYLNRFNIYQTLERSNVIDQSGIPLSNSRLLSVQQTWSAAPSAATLIDLFLFHSVLIRVYLSGANIEI